MFRRLLLIICLALLLGSCAVTLDETIPSTEVIVRYGTPYYYDNILTYYHYNGWYYYPYYRDRTMYYHRFTKPLPPRAGRPGQRDFRPRGGVPTPRRR